MYGALNNISTDVIEAARIDGANAVQIALRIQLPMLRKWIAYMGVMSLAAGTQLFVEPQLLSPGQQRGRAQRLLAQPARLPVRVPAERLQRRGRDLAPAARSSRSLLSAVFVTRGGLFEKE